MDNQDDHAEVARAMWDEAAATFDDAPDHGLRDPHVRAAWIALLRRLLPIRPCRVLDIGCGTGSLSLVLAELGHTVTGVDFSPAMIAIAREKAARADRPVQFHVMDAAAPRFAATAFDVVLCRHILWALPQPAEVLGRWASLLNAGGVLVLIEGFWHTGAGLHAAEIVPMLPDGTAGVTVHELSAQADLWGGDVTDERYAIVCTWHAASNE